MALGATPVRAVEMKVRTILEVEGQNDGSPGNPRPKSPQLGTHISDFVIISDRYFTA
jgi:hypothetical protein